MNKLKLFVSVGICGILFTGCGMFEDMFSSEIKYRKTSKADDCIPSDLIKRLANKRYYDNLSSYKTPVEHFEHYSNKRYGKIFVDYRYEGTGTTKCYDLLVESYNETIKKYADLSIKLPTNIKEEIAFEKEWLVCDKMPFWLETKLDEYISQNRGDDIAYINASKFKGVWNGKLTNSNKYVWGDEFLRNDIGRMANCVAYKTAIQAIENDLIDLGNGKKAKCADLSYDDAPKCLNYFVSVYDKTYKDKEKELKAEQQEIRIKKERMKYEQINRQ